MVRHKGPASSAEAHVLSNRTGEEYTESSTHAAGLWGDALQARTTIEEYAMKKKGTGGEKSLPVESTAVDLLPDRLLRLQQVLALIPVSRSTWYAGIQGGRYPRGQKISERLVGWRLGDIIKLAKASSDKNIVDDAVG